MAKDRNTMAKRQREVEKRQKAAAKQDKRAQRKTESTDSSSQTGFQLSDGEVSVLAVFRKYLMTPGQMLCLSNTDIDSMKNVLESLITAGLLVPEDFKGGYSLTPVGFKAMNEQC